MHAFIHSFIHSFYSFGRLFVRAEYVFSICSKVTDDSGIKLLTTDEKLAKTAAVYLLGTGGSVPKYGVTYLETACRVRLPKGVEMHPFGFRTHTHKVRDA